MRAIGDRQRSTERFVGVSFGLFSVLAWSVYVVYARLGAVQGLQSIDFALLRFGVAGAIALPYVLLHQPVTMCGIGWSRALILTLVGGPLFIGLGAGGFLFAPLAYGAALQPAIVALFSIVLGVVITRRRPHGFQLLGVALICLGLMLLISGTGGFGMQLLTGTGMFIAAGALWAIFTTLIGLWNVAAIPATAVVSVLSAAAVLPGYWFFGEFDNIAALPMASLLAQVGVQGVVAGLLAVVAYTQTVVLLGSAKASVFPSMVPVCGIALGIPLVREVPNLGQVLATFFVGIGMVVVLTGKPTDLNR